jgi:hypothetical protein
MEMFKVKDCGKLTERGDGATESTVVPADSAVPTMKCAVERTKTISKTVKAACLFVIIPYTRFSDYKTLFHTWKTFSSGFFRRILSAL